MHAEERTVRYVQQVQREDRCVQRERLRQVRVRRKLTGQREPYAQKNRLRQREPYAQRDRLRQREWYAQKDRLRQQDVPAEREDRYVRREMTDHSVQAVTERTVRFVTAVTEEGRVRKEGRVTTAMEEAVVNRDSEDAITVMEETVRELVLTEEMITAEMSVRTGMRLQS